MPRQRMRIFYLTPDALRPSPDLIALRKRRTFAAATIAAPRSRAVQATRCQRAIVQTVACVRRQNQWPVRETVVSLQPQRFAKRKIG